MFYDYVVKRVNVDLLLDWVKWDMILKFEIECVWEQNYKVYGVCKVWYQLCWEGFDVVRCIVVWLMKDLGLEGIICGKNYRMMILDKFQLCFLDKVNCQFKVLVLNMFWVSDFIYVVIWQGFVYVVFVIDVFV